MKLKNKKIGIWGLGVVGKSAVRYMHMQGAQIQVLDSRALTTQEQEFLTQYQTPWFGSDKLAIFLEQNDYILPSPGIDLRPYAQYQSKWLSELDLFRAAYTKPIIAITGSIGKTSVTHLLSTLLNRHYTVATGGNIGTAMFDLLTTPSDMAVLEVSSFQLDLCQSFAPDLAIWTNFYPNHLDRHGSEQEYFKAKGKIVARQHEGQKALMPLSIHQKLTTSAQPFLHTTNLNPFVLSLSKDTNAKSPFAPFDRLRANGLNVFCLNKPTNTELEKLNPDCTLFYIDNNHIVKRHNNHEQHLISLSNLPELSFIENWLIICSALTLLNIPLDSLELIKNQLTVPEHRLEKVATINNITFYNDSKSTTPQSTLAAIAQLQGKSIHLFIGGMSKGVDRAPFIEQLKGNVKQVYCFGKESEQLYNVCTQAAIPAVCCSTLEEAFAACVKQSMPGEQVVFSPAGASFDLFKDYKERGNRFKELVKNINGNQV